MNAKDKINNLKAVTNAAKHWHGVKEQDVRDAERRRLIVYKIWQDAESDLNAALRDFTLEWPDEGYVGETPHLKDQSGNFSP